MLDTSKRVVIVGLGLLGGRYALGLTRAGFAVDGIDRSPEAVEFALKEGYIQRGAAETLPPCWLRPVMWCWACTPPPCWIG